MLNDAQNNVIIYDMNTNRRDYINDPQRLINIATPGQGKIIHETGSNLNDNERHTIKWLHNNIGGNITVLAENNPDGQPNPDLLWNNVFVDIKHTSGTVSTLSTHARNGMKQTNGGGVIIDITGSLLADEDVINAIRRRLISANGSFALLLKNEEIVAYLERQ